MVGPDIVLEKCDLLTGDWVPNPSGPTYTNESCPLIEGHQNCMRNGRPDSGYLHWKWKPRDCQLPRFNAERFLALMRNKAWALIGDSISRNHVQSLLCMLAMVFGVPGLNFPFYHENCVLVHLDEEEFVGMYKLRSGPYEIVCSAYAYVICSLLIAITESLLIHISIAL